MKQLLVILVILKAALLSGCVQKLPVQKHSLGVAVPDRWEAGELAATKPDEDWWTYFNNPELEGIVEAALKGNKDLHAAAVRIEIAHQDAIIAGAPLLPELNVTFNRNQQRQNFIGFPIPGRKDTVLSTTSKSYSLRIGASWEPDLWGRIRSGESVALTNTRIRFADLAAARLSLSGQVAKAWFASIEAQRQLDLAQATLESFSFSSDRVRARFQTGLRPALDLRLALAEVASARASLEQHRGNRRRAVLQLETLMGKYPDGHYVTRPTLPDLPDGIPGPLPAELVHRRPDLIAAELQLLAADTRIIAAQADLRPRFSLTSATGTSSRALIDLLQKDQLVWNFVGNLVKPLFNNGKLKATVARSESQAEEARAHYESRLLQSYQEVESALATEDVLMRREQALQEAVLHSSAARALAEQRYQAGLTGIITVLAAQRTAYNVESQLLGVKRARLDNRVDLHLALGGGFNMGDIPTEIEVRRILRVGEGGKQ